MMAPRSARSKLLLVGLLFAFASAHAEGPNKPRRPSDPVVSIPLDDLGFEQPQARLLTGGATMFTVNFVDESHLLVTFNYHGLIPRVADGSSQDGDRLVAALLLELPTGKIIASTHWHTRDREQYLWPLSHGIFLLRLGRQVTILDPLRNFHRGSDPFAQQTFLTMDRRIGYITVSPGGELLVIETVPEVIREEDQVNGGLGAFAGTPPRTPELVVNPNTEIHFYRLIESSQTGEPTHLVASAAGTVSAHTPIRIPATAEGFLDLIKESPNTWLFDFQSHAGKRVELSPFDTTCTPNPYFVSRTDFVAFGCHGSSNSLEVSGFNLRGEQPWIQLLSGQQIAPYFISAPDAGRFAFSRITVSGSYYDLSNLLPEEITGQEIMIIQSHDGRVLLKLQASPVQRTGQNFDLSPDGLNFTLIRNGKLEVYHLPELTAKDQAQLKLAAASLPERNDGRISLISNRPGQPPAATAARAKPAQAPAEAAKVFTVGPTPDAQSGTPKPDPETPTQGDALPEAPRTAPSLYGPDHPKTTPQSPP